MTVTPLISAADIAAALPALALDITRRLGGDAPVRALVLLNGGMWFASDLLRLLPAHFLVETVRVSSYGAGTTSSGRLEWHTPPPDCAGERVLVIDDVLDSGVTLQQVVATLQGKGARSVHTAVAVDKRERRRVNFSADFALFTVDGGFLVGYGMDCGGFYRNLPYIGIAETEETGGLTGMPFDAK